MYDVFTKKEALNEKIVQHILYSLSLLTFFYEKTALINLLFQCADLLLLQMNCKGRRFVVR